MHTPGCCVNPRIRWCLSRDSMVVWALINSSQHLAPWFHYTPRSSSIQCLCFFRVSRKKQDVAVFCAHLLVGKKERKHPKKLRKGKRALNDKWPFVFLWPPIFPPSPKTVMSTKIIHYTTKKRFCATFLDSKGNLNVMESINANPHALWTV